MEQFNHRGSIGGWSNSTIEVVLVDGEVVLVDEQFNQFNHRGSIGGWSNSTIEVVLVDGVIQP